MTEDKQRWPLIAIEWIDGSGKWTQVRLLVQYLREKLGKAVEEIDFPKHGEDSALLADAYLNWKFWKDPNAFWAKIPSTMFALDRALHAPEIRKWQSEWKTVIANRYTTSNMWHQAWKIKDLKERDAFLEWIRNTEYHDFEIPEPNCVVLVDMPPEIAQQNVDKKSAAEREYAGWQKRDIHEADLDHLKNSAEAYRYVADKYGRLKLNPAPNWVLRSIEENQKALIDLLRSNGVI